jgi:hypothetical protein
MGLGRTGDRALQGTDGGEDVGEARAAAGGLKHGGLEGADARRDGLAGVVEAEDSIHERVELAKEIDRWNRTNSHRALRGGQEHLAIALENTYSLESVNSAISAQCRNGPGSIKP